MRPFLQAARSLSFAFIVFALQVHSTGSHAATPTDIATFQELLNTSSQDISTSELEIRLVKETLKQVDSIARTRVYPNWFRSSQPLIEQEAATQVRDGLRTGNRRDAIIDAITGVTAERVMAKAAGLPNPVNPKQNPSQPLSLSASVSGGGLLGLVADKSQIINDRGSFGSGNGILDPGEFAEVKLVFENLGKERLTSTSVYVDSLDSCLYSEDPIGGEVEMPELEPGESGQITLNLYASANCPSNTASLRLRAHDSHLFSKNPTRFNINFQLGSLGKSRLVNLRVDTDDYGHSEPTSYPKLKPLDRVEVATGLSLTGSGYSEVEQRFHVMKPLQSTHSPAFVETRRTGNGSVAPMADDLDLVVPAKQALQSGLQPIADRMQWIRADDARIFVSVDSTVVRDSKEVTEASIETVVRMDKNRVEAILREHVNIDPVTSRAPATADGLPIISVNGFTVSVADADALMQDLESSAKIREVAGVEEKPGIAYVLRHYIELPVEWTPLRCTLKPDLQSVALGTTAQFTATVSNAGAGLSYNLKAGNTSQSSGQVPSNGRLSLQFKTTSTGTQNVTMEVKRKGHSVAQCTAEIKVPEPACGCAVNAPRLATLGDTFFAGGTAAPGCSEQIAYTMKSNQQKHKGSLPGNKTVRHQFKATKVGKQTVSWTLLNNGTQTTECNASVTVKAEKIGNVFAAGISKVKTQTVDELFTSEERTTMGVVHVQGGPQKLRVQSDFVFGQVSNTNTVVEFGVGPRYNLVHDKLIQVGAFAELGLRTMQNQPLPVQIQAIYKTGVSSELTLGSFVLWAQTSLTPKTPDDKFVGSAGSFTEYGVLRPHMSTGVGFVF
ncbi:MAG: hypothetical protein ACPGTU_08090 [Myxococcota bacterium]